MRRTVLALVALLAAAACASPKDDGRTIVERTKVSTSTGGPLASVETPPLAPPDDPNAPCKHVWEHLRQGTHSWLDESGDLPFVSLCTPIACRRCGEVRHECTQGRIRAR